MALNAMSVPTSMPLYGGGTPIMPGGGPSVNFGNIQGLLTPAPNSEGISPEAQKAINSILGQRDYFANLGSSQAQGLSLARGQAGSSTEQFGVQQALTQANIAAMGQITPFISQDIQNQLAQRQQLAGLTSDQIASMTNYGLSQQNLALQQNIGQQGVNLGYANLGAAQNLANKTSQNQLIGNLSQLFAPSIFGGGGGFGSGGGRPNLGTGTGGYSIGGGGGGFGGSPALTGTPTAVGLPSMGANPLSLYGMGVPGTSGGGAFSGALSGGFMPNLGAGALGMTLGQQLGGQNNLYSNAGGVAGGIAGSFFGPMGTAVGSTGGELLGGWASKSPANRLALATGGLSTAGAAVGKALFGGSTGTTQMEGSSGSLDPTTFGKAGNTVRYNANQKGSFESLFNKQLQSYTPDQLVQRYQNGTSDMYQTPLDQNQAKAYQAAVSMNGGQPVSGSQYAWYLNTYGSLYGVA